MDLCNYSAVERAIIIASDSAKLATLQRIASRPAKVNAANEPLVQILLLDVRQPQLLVTVQYDIAMFPVHLSGVVLLSYAVSRRRLRVSMPTDSSDRNSPAYM